MGVASEAALKDTLLVTKKYGERLPSGRAGLCNIVLNELRCHVFLIGFCRVLLDFDGKFRWQRARNYSSRAQSDSSEMESALVPTKSVL